MPDITILPANLVTLVCTSCLYGILLLLFIATVYFLATRRTLAGHRQTPTRNFTSLVFLGVASLFLVITAHWIVIVYQAFFAFIHLGSAATEDAFYANLAQRSEIAKVVLFCISVFLGNSLVIYRLWIVWARDRYIPILPALASIGVAVAFTGIIHDSATWEPRLRGSPFEREVLPWVASGAFLTLVTNVYCTVLILLRIRKFTKTVSESRLMGFLSILVESAALQTLWIIFTAIAELADSGVDFIASDTFPVITGISNLLIHARIGLGWSQDSLPHIHESETKVKCKNRLNDNVV
ncbi:hypothetical protein B0H10DRAFT_1889254 [Mycena sp. CBHHK59/15]|nr:hypothetical protein B0H10DRAFT_1889254 [Mycena sp. CBHHK59/15]